MYSQLCQRIRELTLQFETLVNKNEIEQYHNVLVERQKLLESLMRKYQCFNDDNNKSDNESYNEREYFKNTFVELIYWLQQQDLVNQDKVVKLKELNKKNSITQRKINKALQQYKNIN